MRENLIYMDHGATAPLRKAALEAMLPYLQEEYGNASALYSLGASAREGLENARQLLAASIGAAPGEIYFTSGGTESDNWALVAAAEAMEEKGRHIITSSLEHHAVLHTCEYLKRRGFEVTYLPADAEGRVNPAQLESAIREDTILISVMTANNEVGSVQPIAKMARIARERDILFHTDAVQAYGKMPLSVREFPVDLLSVSAHKIGGPKGVGFLYIRNGIPMGAWQHGGMQERGRRAGTENVAGVVGFAAAAAETMKDMQQVRQQEANLQRFFYEVLLKEIPTCKWHGPVPAKVNAESENGGVDVSIGEGNAAQSGVKKNDRSVINSKKNITEQSSAESTVIEKRLFNNVNFSIPGIKAETALITLDREGVCASAGSACTTGARSASHVLTAMGISPKEAGESLRFTLGAENTKEEIRKVVDVLVHLEQRIRSMETDW